VLLRKFIQYSSGDFCIWIEVFVMPNTHRRRDSTVELSCVGGVYLVWAYTMTAAAMKT